MASKIHILALVHGPRSWPEPLATYVAQGRINIEIISTLFDAATALSRPRSRILALLLEAGAQSATQILLLKTLKHHKSLRICILPTHLWTHPLAREMAELGALNWDDSLLMFERALQSAPTQELCKGNSHICDSKPYLSRAHNNPPESLSDQTAGNPEIFVAEGFMSRYDEPYSDTTISDGEVRALLGNPE